MLENLSDVTTESHNGLKNKKKKKKRTRRENFKPPNNLTILEMNQIVDDLQQNLAVAIRSSEEDLILKAVNKIIRSNICRAHAVYRTISSKGARTPGFNDPTRLNTQKQYNALLSSLWKIIKHPDRYKASPLSRIYLPKSKGGMRPISIPTYLDRTVQTFYNTILDVFQEETADKKSFGFRKFRSPGWAAKSIILAFWSRKSLKPPKRIIELDIAKCFDNINHDFILNNVASVKINGKTIQVIPQSIMKSWLKQGFFDKNAEYVDQNILQPTDVGVPQGGTISPTIMNMVLNGIENCLEFPYDPIIGPNSQYYRIIRFADDLLLLLGSKDNIQIALQQLNTFLQPRGLTLAPNKMRIVVTQGHPFNFVGYKFISYTNHGKEKIYSYPPKEALSKLFEKLRDILPRNKQYIYKKGKYIRIPCPTPKLAFWQANAILRGWLNFYRCSNASDTFSYVKFRTFHIARKFLYFYMSLGNKYKINKKVQATVLYQDMWTKYLKKHPNRNERWWCIPNGKKPIWLIHPQDYGIENPSIIEGKSAYHPEDREVLLTKALGWKFGFRGQVYKKSKGICKCCNLPIGEENFQIHHILPVKYKGTYALNNVIPLCIPCHHLVTNAVRNTDTPNIIDLINRGILSSKLIEILNL